MAAGLGFKDFVTGEVLTAADVDGYLMQGIWVFASAAARSAAVTSPQEGNYSYLKDTNSTEYYTGSAWVAAGGGGGGGKVLQVVQGTYATATTVASTSFTDTGLTATITPTVATSKVLVFVNQQYDYYRGAKDQGINIQLLRGASAIYNSGANEQFYTQANGASEIRHINYTAYTYLDSPATTSATTYKTQGKCLSTASGGTSTYQYGSNTSTMTLLEIGA